MDDPSDRFPRSRRYELYERVTRISIYIMVAAMPISISLSQLAMGTAALSALLAWSLQPKPRPNLAIGLEKPIAAFILAELLAFVFSTNHWESFLFLKRLLLFSVIYIVALKAPGLKMRRQLMVILLSSFTLYSALGIFTYLTSHSVRLRHIHNSMTAGGMTMIAVLVTVALLLKEADRRKQAGLLLVGLINLWALLATSTRSAWLGGLTGLMVIFISLKKEGLLTLPIMIIVFYIFTPDEIAYHINHFFDPSWGTNAERLIMWKTGFNIWQDYPIFGIGDVSAQAVFRQYMPADFTYLIGHFHNNWIHIAVTLGAVGLLAFAYLMITLLVHLVMNAKRQKSAHPFEYALAVSVLAVYFGFHVSGLFEWNFGDAEIITIVWFLIGLTFSRHREMEQ